MRIPQAIPESAGTMTETPSLTLAQLGCKPFFSEQVTGEESRDRQPVRVMSVHRQRVTVSDEVFEDSISSSSPARGDRRTDPPSATGC